MLETRQPTTMHDPPQPSNTGQPQRAEIVTSEELLRGRRELWIEHGEDMYRLRLTSSGKLYLTK